MEKTQQKENCYFYTDCTLPVSEQTIQVMCVNCHVKNPDLGWFWEGSKMGYGPFDFICNVCGYVIHKERIEDESQSSSN